MFQFFTLVLLISVLENGVDACYGYKWNMQYIRNCYDGSLIKLTDGNNILLDQDCKIYLKGCIDFTKEIKAAKTTYSIQKAPLPTLNGTVDLCNLPQLSEMIETTKFLSFFGLPEKCPYPKKKICFTDQSFETDHLKNILELAEGDTSVKLDIEHNNGEKSCVEFALRITKD